MKNAGMEGWKDFRRNIKMGGWKVRRNTEKRICINCIVSDTEFWTQEQDLRKS